MLQEFLLDKGRFGLSSWPPANGRRPLGSTHNPIARGTAQQIQKRWKQPTKIHDPLRARLSSHRHPEGNNRFLLLLPGGSILHSIQGWRPPTPRDAIGKSNPPLLIHQHSPSQPTLYYLAPPRIAPVRHDQPTRLTSIRNCGYLLSSHQAY